MCSGSFSANSSEKWSKEAHNGSASSTHSSTIYRDRSNSSRPSPARYTDNATSNSGSSSVGYQKSAHTIHTDASYQQHTGSSSYHRSGLYTSDDGDSSIYESTADLSYNMDQVYSPYETYYLSSPSTDPQAAVYASEISIDEELEPPDHHGQDPIYQTSSNNYWHYSSEETYQTSPTTRRWSNEQLPEERLRVGLTRWASEEQRRAAYEPVHRS